MEVLEHVLHHVTDVGFHYALPEHWGLCEGTTLHAAMVESVEKGKYDLSDYEDEMKHADPKELLRVELQEFGYWVITTGFDLQAEFGPWNGDQPTAEWKVQTSEQMKSELPLSYALFMETVYPVLVAPKAESMRALLAFGTPEEGAEGGA